MDLTRRTRKSEAKELLRLLTQGPASYLPDYPFGTLTAAQRAEVKKSFHLWVDSWVLPRVQYLVPELQEKDVV